MELVWAVLMVWWASFFLVLFIANAPA